MIELPLLVILLIGVCIFLLLMFLKMHVGLAMMIGGFIGILLARGLPAALSTLGVTVYRVGSSEYLAVIPLFVLMGIIAGAGGVSKDAFNTLYKWFGHLPGGLAMATIGACAAFGAVCGDNVATAATMTKVALPEMRKYGYSDELSLGTIANGGNLGILIPPSTAFIVYGFVTQISVGALFIAGIVPGILLTILFIVQIYFQCRMNPKLATRAPAASWKERLVATKGIWGIVVVFLIVMGGLLAGFFTPSEGGAVGTVAIVLVSLVNRQLTLKNTGHSLLEAGKITAMIMLLVFGAMLFSQFMTTTEVAKSFTNLITNAGLNRYVILALILIFYLILGCIMDIFALLIITLPIFFPIVCGKGGLGFDSLQFGVLSVIAVMVGCITPPVGVVVFALGGMVRDVPIYTIFRGCVPFLFTMVIFIILIVVWPQLSTALPDLMIPYR
jgi:C4-dicarboxylate transporter, DctM subunit